MKEYSELPSQEPSSAPLKTPEEVYGGLSVDPKRVTQIKVYSPSAGEMVTKNIVDLHLRWRKFLEG